MAIGKYYRAHLYPHPWSYVLSSNHSGARETRFFMTEPEKPSRSGRLWGLPPGEQVREQSFRENEPIILETNSGAASSHKMEGLHRSQIAAKIALRWACCCVRTVCKSACATSATLSTHASDPSTIHTALSSHTSTPSAQV